MKEKLCAERLNWFPLEFSEKIRGRCFEVLVLCLFLAWPLRLIMFVEKQTGA